MKLQFLINCTLTLGKRSKEGEVFWLGEHRTIRTGDQVSAVRKKTRESDCYDLVIGGKTYPNVPKCWFKVLTRKEAAAPRTVLESFPLPVPATLATSQNGCYLWFCPTVFNDLPVTRQVGIPTFKVTENPEEKLVISLCLEHDRDKGFSYRCVFFGDAN